MRKMSEIRKIDNLRFTFEEKPDAKVAALFANYVGSEWRPIGGNNVAVNIEFDAYAGESGSVPVQLHREELLRNVSLFTSDGKEMASDGAENGNLLGYTASDKPDQINVAFRRGVFFSGVNKPSPREAKYSGAGTCGENKITYYIFARPDASEHYSVYLKIKGLDEKLFPDPTTRDERADFREKRLMINTLPAIDYSRSECWEIEDGEMSDVVNNVNIDNWHTFFGKVRKKKVTIKYHHKSDYENHFLTGPGHRRVTGGAKLNELMGDSAAKAYFYGRCDGASSEASRFLHMNFWFVEPQTGYGFRAGSQLDYMTTDEGGDFSDHRKRKVTIGPRDRRLEMDADTVSDSAISIYLVNLQLPGEWVSEWGNAQADWRDNISAVYVIVFDRFGNSGRLGLGFRSNEWLPHFIT